MSIATFNLNSYEYFYQIFLHTDSPRNKHCDGESIISQTGGVKWIVGAHSNAPTVATRHRELKLMAARRFGQNPKTTQTYVCLLAVRSSACCAAAVRGSVNFGAFYHCYITNDVRFITGHNVSYIQHWLQAQRQSCILVNQMQNR